MKKVYDFFVGRKLYYFNQIFVINCLMKVFDKWTPEFGYFSIGLYVTIVLGVEFNKAVKSHYDKDTRE